MPSSSPSVLWGWTAPARVLLIVTAFLAAIGLETASLIKRGPVVRVPPLVVDPNTAPPEVLLALPRLGPALVRKLVAERAKAPFRSLDDLHRRVRGIGPATIAALRPHLRLEVFEPGLTRREAALAARAGNSAP
jgi:competence protein ComEA